MANLGDIVYDKMLVTKITYGGTPIEYLNLETGERIKTSYGASVEKKRKILVLTEGELSNILQKLNIERYSLLKNKFIELLSEIQEGVNKRCNSDKAFVYALSEEEEKDYLLVQVDGKQIQVILQKEKLK